MGNAAIDYEKQEALNMARMQPTDKGDFGVPREGAADSYDRQRLNDNFHVPQRGRADNYNDTQENNPESHAERLDQARQGSKGNNEADKAKNLVQDAAAMATPMGAISLIKQIDFLGDIPYFAAIGAAILKDVSDLVLVGSLPGLGTVISICASIFIFMMMLLVGASGKRKVARGNIFNAFFKKVGILFGGTMLEFLPGLNFVPIETVTVIMIYGMTLSERKHAPEPQIENQETEEDEE